MTRSHLLFSLAVGCLVVSTLKTDGFPNDSTKPTPPTANPRVAPGKVKWHLTFDAARAASAKSGKPVFLFQMLGKLDQEFC